MKTYKIMSLILILLFVSAFKINSPELRTYNSSKVNFSVSHSATLENISYILDNELFLACENCYSYEDYLVLDEGHHVIEAFGVIGNTTYYDTVDFYVEKDQNFSFKVISPISKTYTSLVALEVVSDKKLDHINYELDGVTLTACKDCDKYKTVLDLDEGDHELTVYGALNDTVKHKAAKFSLDFSGYFTIWINSPEPLTYDTNIIDIDVDATTTLDEIAVQIGPYRSFCNYCSKFTDQVALKPGSYNLVVRGTLDNIIRDEVLHFYIEGESFDLGFEKLPQQVEAGEIGDGELADIIRNNEINPGILNRLIKTGKLGEESLAAILDTQFKPVGLWQKILSFIGIKSDTYASLMYEEYDLPPNIEKKLLSRDDLPKNYLSKIKEKVQKETEEKEQKQEQKQEETKGKPDSLPVGKQDKQNIPQEKPETPNKPDTPDKAQNKVTAKASNKNGNSNSNSKSKKS